MDIEKEREDLLRKIRALIKANEELLEKVEQLKLIVKGNEILKEIDVIDKDMISGKDVSAEKIDEISRRFQRYKKEVQAHKNIEQ